MAARGKQNGGKSLPRKLVVQVVDQNDHPLVGALVQSFRNGKRVATVKLGTKPAEYEVSSPTSTLRFVVTYQGNTQEKTAKLDDVLLRFKFDVLSEGEVPIPTNRSARVDQQTNLSQTRQTNLNELSGLQRAVLREAVLASFDYNSLDRLLQDKDAKPLSHLTKPGGFKSVVFDLIKRTQMEGWTEQLVAWMQTATKNPKMQRVFSQLTLIDVDGNAHLINQSLEKTVKEKAGMADFLSWEQKLSRLRANVCRIEDPSDERKALGTGFLVGSDLVLTNYHVVENYIDEKDPQTGTLRDPTRLTCRFDYALESTGTIAGTTVAVAGQDWLVAHSRYSKVDPGDQGGLPKENEMDYALIRLAELAGDKPGPSGLKRRWIQVSTAPPQPQPTDVLFIVQHPKGEPLKLAVGTVLKLNANGTRLRYDTNTAAGSSGSPCLDAKLDLVALHHGGDPDAKKLARYNQGIPIDKIISQAASQKNVPRFWE